MSGIKDTIKQMNEYGKKHIPFVIIIDFDMKNPLIYQTEELLKNDIWISFPDFSNKEINTIQVKFKFEKEPITFNQYSKAFDVVKASINRGDTFLLNLTFPTNLQTDLTLPSIFSSSKAKYKLKFKDQFVVFSPESFIQINGNKISSFPMKGTMDASIDYAEEKLLKDIKEISEHNTIVDLIRNDLSMVAKKVEVERFRYIEKIITHEKELLQTSSKISGNLPDNWNENIGDILFALLPAGSISGAPKKKTIEIIKKAEGYNRGYFTGVFGYFDGSSFDSAVLIRYIENQNGKMVFKSGGGITFYSDCKQEYSELIDKVYVPIK